MGVYWIIVNASKKEVVHGGLFGTGLKLGEFDKDPNTLRVLYKLLTGDWKGDYLFVVPDNVSPYNNFPYKSLFNQGLTRPREEFFAPGQVDINMAERFGLMHFIDGSVHLPEKLCATINNKECTLNPTSKDTEDFISCLTTTEEKVREKGWNGYQIAFGVFGAES
jgi:hypothetical protein